MRVYDVTVPMHSTLAAWPGDLPYRLDWNLHIGEGIPVNLASISLSVHTGTHADAPFHFLKEGATIDQCDPDVYCGPAVVIDVRGLPVICREHVPEAELLRASRVLFKTGAWTDHTCFPESVPVIAPDLPAYLREHGVILLGVDVPSVDPIQSKELQNHHGLAAAGISILESLDLADIEAGVYELIALPLRLIGADGAPVRAILRR